ncbi:hypothetical protein L6Q96_05765 [Candidatus Binatia bacterium]|nr:hypothetical protein [Candidatus Binatia bacterium]
MSLNVVPDTHAYLLQPDSVLPAQYFSGRRSRGTHDAEHELVVAVLQDAIDCFQKHLFARERKARQLYVDAEAWIMSDDRRWPFSFENICDLLDIDAPGLRAGLLRWKAARLQAASREKIVQLEPRRPAERAAPRPRRARS